MKSDPAVPGSSLTSKPTWSNTSVCSATSAFCFRLQLRGMAEAALLQQWDKRVPVLERDKMWAWSWLRSGASHAT